MRTLLMEGLYNLIEEKSNILKFVRMDRDYLQIIQTPATWLSKNWIKSGKSTQKHLNTLIKVANEVF